MTTKSHPRIDLRDPDTTPDGLPLPLKVMARPWWERALNAVGSFIRDHGIAAFFAVALLAILSVSVWAAFKLWERQADRQAKLEERQVAAIEKMADNGKEQNEIANKHAVALFAIEGLLRVQTQADLRAVGASAPTVVTPPPKVVPMYDGLPAARPLKTKKR